MEIVLAALNVCYFASVYGVGVPHNLTNNFDKIMTAQNIPALFTAIVSREVLEFFFSKSFGSFHPFRLIGGVVFVTLQWLFIGWSAKIIARRIRRRAGARL